MRGMSLVIRGIVIAALAMVLASARTARAASPEGADDRGFGQQSDPNQNPSSNGATNQNQGDDQPDAQQGSDDSNDSDQDSNDDNDNSSNDNDSSQDQSNQ